ncbi:hypothetical protein F8M41_008130 [Gigaspora margarita]|uniref:Uncharacterized protein n=1 Tax=Gigaspora margarita TaxID=4874 RepID=A0A8H4AVU7_GIGMA|nr:hypothetical protein F8M41_008130 [Gigaspora margarita]
MKSQQSFLLEVKNEIRTGSSDPTIQGSLSYVRHWAQNNFNNLRSLSNCPSIIVAVACPWICILGAIYFEKCVIDPLQSHKQKYLQIVAQLFELLRLAAERLKVFYKNLMPSNDQWLYPFPNQY